MRLSIPRPELEQPRQICTTIVKTKPLSLLPLYLLFQGSLFQCSRATHYNLDNRILTSSSPIYFQVCNQTAYTNSPSSLSSQPL